MSTEGFIDSLIHGLRQRDIRLALVNDELSVDAPKGTLQQQDVAQLKAHKGAIIEFLRRHRRRFEPPPLLPNGDDGPAPLSLAQQRLWIVDQLAGPDGAMHYHVPSCLRLRGALRVDALKRALDGLIARHEVLRSTVAMRDGLPMLSIPAHAEFALQFVDLSDRAEDEREPALQRRLQLERQKPFDLRVGPLIRGCLVKMGDEEHVLFVTKHHIVSDGWSSQIMWHDICAMYEAFCQDRPNPLPPVRVHYSDYARWQRGWLCGPVLEEHLSYWKRQLAGVSKLDLRFDRVRESAPTFQGSVHAFVVPTEIAAGLRAISAESGASLFMTVFAVFHLLLSRFGAQRDFAVSTAVAGRNHPGTENLVGPCVNNLLLRLGAEPGMTFHHLLTRARTVVLDAYAHQDLPYEELVAELRADGSASTPVAFVMAAASRNSTRLLDLDLEPVFLRWSTAKNELTMNVQETPEELYGLFEYTSDVFEPRTMERLGHRFVAAARQIVADPDLALDAIDLALPDDGDEAYFYSARHLDDRAYWIAQRGDALAAGLSTAAAATARTGALAGIARIDPARRAVLARAAAECDAGLTDWLRAAAILYLHKAVDVDLLRVGVAAGGGDDVVPLTSAVSADDTLSQYLRRTVAGVAEALSHRGCGSAGIRRLLGGEDDAALYRTVVDVADGDAPIASADAEFRILARIADTGGIEVRFAADAAGCPQWRLDAHARAFEALLARLDAADAHLRTLSMLDDEMRRKVASWSEGGATEPVARDSRIEALFEARAAAQPDAIAIRHGDLQVDYAALDRRANRIARRMCALGAAPGAFVVVFLDRGVDLVASILAVLKAGATYVPVDPATSAERLGFIVDDIRPTIVVTTSALSHLLPQTAATVLALDDEADALEALPGTGPVRPDGGAGDPRAYAIYTSGSTGLPKGVLIEHANLVNHAMWMCREFGLSADDRALQFASISFDASAEEIFPTLIAGATIVVRQADVPSATELLDAAAAQGVTILNLPTAYWHAFVDALSGQRIATGALRLIIVGGERVSLESLHAWRACAGDAVEWVNSYGPTEATITATFYRAPRQIEGLTEVPIGRPIDGAIVRVLDRAGEPTPPGLVGELCIGGAGVSPGYWCRDALTAEKFVADVHAAGADARLYRTGDLAVWRDDGELLYVGRNDDQVKLRGFRIEPGEIEAHLRAAPRVRDAAVLVREDVPGDLRLVAYVVCARDDQPTIVEALRAGLKDALPAYMMPHAFVLLDALPMTLNGKLDRRALPAPALTETSANAYEAPQGPVEEALARIWQDVLHVERVGRHDNYFRLGGSSVSAIQVIGRANHAGLKLTLNIIFEQQTIAELARALGRSPQTLAVGATAARRKRDAGQVPERGAIQGPVPFTPIQRAILPQGEEAVRALLSTQVLTCMRPLSPDLLHTALRKLVRYHDALRLGFTCDAQGEWSQSVAPLDAVDACTLLQHETSEVADEDMQTEIGAAMKRLCERIDSATGPLLYATLIDVESRGAQYLLLAAHHFAVDPMSWAILLQDLQTIYDQLEASASVRLPVKGATIKQWGDAIEAFANSAASDPDVEYWTRLDWAGHARLPVPNETGEETAVTECVSIEIDEARTRAILDASTRQHAAQVHEVLLSALLCGLWQWSGQREFAIGVYHHGRVGGMGELDVSRTVGWFTVPVPMLLRADGEGGIAPTLRDVKQRLRAMPNEGVGYAFLKHAGRQSGPLPEAHIDVLLNHQGTVAGETPGGLFTTHFDNRRYADVLREAALPWKVAVLSNIANGRLCINFVSLWYSRPVLGSIAEAFEASINGLAGMPSPRV
jgi:amino acid adenylation domain-containing protein